MIKKIEEIAVRSANNRNEKFGYLMEIISDPGVLYQAMGNISTKSGALTKGPNSDPQTVDAMSSIKIMEISESLKNRTFRFKPSRRIYTDKSGKNLATPEQFKKLKELHSKGNVTMAQIKEVGARPIGISSFTDKIVQEAMRIVLNAIYEPEFEKMNVNFGFRPKYGCHDAIVKIQKDKEMLYAIEGDIKGAFDNIDHDILIEILEKKIYDNQFLSLIRGGLKCGIIYLNFGQETVLGTVQGNVVSPLLYNIYFNEFDKFVVNDFNLIVQEINDREFRKDRADHGLYRRITTRKGKLGMNQLRAKLSAYYKIHGMDPTFYKMVEKLKVLNIKYKEIDAIQRKLPSRSLSRQTIKFSYTRYADDWVFFTNASLEQVKEWKELFARWILENLKLTLSPEKTLISDLRNGDKVKFLGYQMTRPKHKRVLNVGRFVIKSHDIARRIKATKQPAPEIVRKYKTRTTNPTVIVSWDRKRILTRLVERGFVKRVGNTWRGSKKNPWTTLSEPEIIDRYNYMIRGYVNYYAPVNNRPTDIEFIHYLLVYSCYHTLASKRKCSIHEVIYRLGKNKELKYDTTIKIQNKDGTVTNKTQHLAKKLIDWKGVLNIIRKIKLKIIENRKQKNSIIYNPVQVSIDNICDVKVNWRTKYKLTNHCAICGSEDRVQYHHVKHIRIGKVEGFTQIMKQLNRKQIPCCWECHRKIHRGEYDGIPLSRLYDEELIIL